MLSVDEALAAIAPHVRPLAAVRLPLGDALGRVLAQNVTSDIDSPPYDKAMMDGYAIAPGDSSEVRQVVEEVLAGDVPTRTLLPGQATRIMTGAPVPDGTGAVIPVEQTERQGDNHVRLLSQVPPGKHIMRRGSAMHAGQQVLAAGTIIRPLEVALLAEVGAAELDVIPAPRVAILATGNEIIPCGHFPAPGQIRNTNGPALAAAARQVGAEPLELPPARDDIQELEARIRQGLEADVLLVTGGVSAGVADLVPQALATCGVKQVFHKVDLKPGKPLWFGVAEGPRPTLVFGLPGNPVSGLVCFRLFVRPAIERMSGRRQAISLDTLTAELAEPYTHRGGRETFRPAHVTLEHTPPTLTAPPWQGSADIAGLANTNCLMRLPREDAALKAGDEVQILLWD